MLPTLCITETLRFFESPRFTYYSVHQRYRTSTSTLIHTLSHQRLLYRKHTHRSLQQDRRNDKRQESSRSSGRSPPFFLTSFIN